MTVANGATAFDADGRLASEATSEKLRLLLEQLVQTARAVREARAANAVPLRE